MLEEWDETIDLYLCLGRFLQSSDPSERLGYLQILLRESKQENPEASYYVAQLLLDGVLDFPGGDSQERAMTLLCKAANAGCLPARRKLNEICETNYRDRVPVPDPLPRVKKEGILFPVITGQYRSSAYNVPAAGLIKGYDVGYSKLYNDTAARDFQPRIFHSLEGKWIF